jgi:hypothetical protein
MHFWEGGRILPLGKFRLILEITSKIQLIQLHWDGKASKSQN